jgi:gamma-glutamyltranspeptidase / glutathione hydrolase
VLLLYPSSINTKVFLITAEQPGQFGPMQSKALFITVLSLSVLGVSTLGCSTRHARLELKDSKKQALAISSSEPDAVKAAETVFSQGGNIADAAVAASFAISVIRQQSTGIGGGGFLVAKLNTDKLGTKELAMDFRERAPRRAKRDMYLKAGKAEKEKSQYGALAAGVPGLVKGLYEFHKSYGKLSWSQVLAPAIKLAREGASVSAHMARAILDQRQKLERDPTLARVFLPKGRALTKGARFQQPELAKTLEGIAQQGPQYFYSGPVAKSLDQFMQTNAGAIRAADLSAYRVIYRKPLKEKWKQWNILSMPPPSSGGIHLVQILKMLEYSKRIHPQEITEVEAFKRAFADRSMHLGDPSFTKVPTRFLLSTPYLKKRASEIDGSILTSKEIKPVVISEPTETTHLSLIDSEGNLVSTTQSVNGWFGAGVTIPDTGIVLNNTMDDFSIQPGVANIFGLIGGAANAVQALKTPLSSMTPTILTEINGSRKLAIGAPGGSRIITNVYLGIRRFDEGMSPEDLMAACRFHHQWAPDKVTLEFTRCQKEKKIFGATYTLEDSDTFGELQMVGQLSNGAIFAAADPRGRGQGRIFARTRE